MGKSALFPALGLWVALCGTAARAEAISTSSPMAFKTCVLSIDVVAQQVGSRPSVIVDTTLLKMVRFHTSDGSVLVTCSKPDGTRVLTRSTKR